MTINIGLIGAGKIERIHGDNIANRIPGSSLAAVCDVNEAAAQTLAEALHVDCVYTNPQDLLQDKNIAAVVICSVSGTHAQLINLAEVDAKRRKN